MKLDITQVINGRLTEMTFAYSFSPDTACVLTEPPLLPEDVAIEPDGIAVRGEVAAKGGYMTFTAQVDVRYTVPCSRCLEDIHEELSFDLSRTVRTGAPSAADNMDDEEWDGVLDDVLYVHDSHLYPDSDILEQIVLELPLYQLCSPDCPGLCPHCGHRFSEGDCGCAAKEAEKKKKEIDPRLAKLQKLLDKSE